jgi:putative transposase
MPYDPEIHHRHSIRLKGYDYAQPGAYFITLCTASGKHLFGEIVEGIMQLNDKGRIVAEELERLRRQFTNVELSAFIIMPNHIHGIIIIKSVGTTHPSPIMHPSGNASCLEASKNSQAGSPVHEANTTRPTGPATGSLGAILGQFKSRVTKRIWSKGDTQKEPVWQRNYYEHIIRNETKWRQIWDYIANNPNRWQEDRFFIATHPMSIDLK